MGKLGAATGDPTAVMADLGVLDDAVNGPEDLPDCRVVPRSTLGSVVGAPQKDR